MRRIALINQKGGVGKTTVTVNLGAALARAGKRVVLVDLDPQANLTLYLGVELASGAPSTYRVLTGEVSFGAALRPTSTPNLRLLPTDIHLSGAELEISGSEGREELLRRALEDWRGEHARSHAGHEGEEPADYVLYDCPPSLGLLSLNALAAADEVFLVVQTQFLALQGTSKLIEVIELVKQRLHPGLRLTGIVPCLYDSRMRLAREVLSELRRYFPAQVFRTPISTNVKLAESPSFAKTIFEYAPESIGARDFASLAHEVLTQEALELAGPATPVPGSRGRKRGALESYASSAASPPSSPSAILAASSAASSAPASLVPGELVPVAPRVRKRPTKPAPENGTTASEAPPPETRASAEVEPPPPAPRPAPVQDPPAPIAAGASATPRRGRAKPTRSD
jgi:chromosome partitioning protein